MSSSAELQLIYKFSNAPILEYPYPHFYIPEIFPADFYATLQKNIPDPAAMIPIGEARPVLGYHERFVMEMGGPQMESLPAEKQEFWKAFSGWLCSGRFANVALQKFQRHLAQRFKEDELSLRNEALLVEDITKYSLGPHTDSPKKIITMLFYLPKDLSQSHLGTSIYVPNDPNFRCPGGPHYGFDGFTRMHTMPFAPNSLFVFFKTDNSFHGVEPVTDPDTKRWLLLYDIYGDVIQAGAQPAAPKADVSFQF